MTLKEFAKYAATRIINSSSKYAPSGPLYKHISSRSKRMPKGAYSAVVNSKSRY